MSTFPIPDRPSDRRNNVRAPSPDRGICDQPDPPYRWLVIRHSWLLAVVLVLLPVQVSTAVAQGRDAEARALYAAGEAAFRDGLFEDALTYFQRSFELSGRVDLLYNIALAADRSRQDAVALAAFRRYLQERPEAATRAELEGRIRALEAAVARARAASPPPVTDDAPTTASATTPEPTAPPPAPVAVTTPAAAPPEVALAVPTTSPPPPSRSDGGAEYDSAPAWALTLSGAGLVAGGVVLLVVGVPDLGAVDSPHLGESYAQAQSRQDTGVALSAAGGVSTVAGLVLGVVGSVLLADAPDSPVALDSNGVRIRF